MCSSSSEVNFSNRISRHPIVGLLTIAGRLQVKRAGVHLRRKIAFQDFLDVLPDPERVERLHVGQAIEE